MHARHHRSRRSSTRSLFLSFFRPLRLEALEDRALLSITPQLVADINPTITQQVHEEGQIVDVGGVGFFVGNEGTNGAELWKTDGTAAGTVLVKDIRSGSAGSLQNTYARTLTNVNGTLFFSANQGGPSGGYELWKSDGTSAGTVLVKDIRTGILGSLPINLTNVNGTLFFTADDGTSGDELWKSDGTPGGTVLVKDIRLTVALGSTPRNLTNANGTLYFTADDGINGSELWRSDGTPAGTQLVKDIRTGGASYPAYLTNVNGTLFFKANDGTHGEEVWKTDPALGAVLFKDIGPGQSSSNPTYLVNVNGTLFFEAQDNNGAELWKSDGTDGGTVPIPVAGSSGSLLRSLTNVSGTLFFNSNAGTNGAELWKSDGTPSGTMLVKDINPGPGNSLKPGILPTFIDVNGTVFFKANDGTHGYELWKSDGTAAGTTLVKDIRNGANDSYTKFLTNVNGKLLFSANDGTHGYELWQTDGTAGGAVVLSRQTADATPSSITIVGGLAFFAADDGTNGVELWKSDGTAAGTMLVKDLNPQGASSNPKYLTNVNGTLFFAADNVMIGTELWKSDGTPGGTVLVTNINTTAGASSSPHFLTNVNGTLYFAADDGTNGVELWKADAVNGAVLVKNIDPTALGPVPIGSSNPNFLTNVNGTLFFKAKDGATGYELWKSDGTLGGTMLVKDINSNGTNSSVPEFLVNVSGTLFFRANDGTNGTELWKSDGTDTGTKMVTDIRAGAGIGSFPAYLTNVNGMLYFSADDGFRGRELWISDGTFTNTMLVRDINVGGNESAPYYLTNVNGTLFFVANDGTVGRELWKSDGTIGGTVFVKDTRSDDAASPRLLTNVNGTLFFAANDNVLGYQLWKSDGTAGGTLRLTNFASGPPSGSAVTLNYLNGRLLFPVSEPAYGSELWSMTLYDWGDAASSFGTTAASGGAHHLSIGPQLGLLRDEETDATPSAAANGDGLNGAADEDGLVASLLMRGETSSVTVDVVADGGTAKLDAWIDFDHNGSFSPFEKIADSRTVASGQTQVAFTVPQTAQLGPATARFRISTAGGLGPTGLAQDGEVEDHILTIAQDLVVNLLTGNGTDKVSIRANGANVEIFDLNASTVIASGPLAFTHSIIVNGSATEADEMTVDYSLAGFFAFAGGIVLDGGASGGDLLTVTGTTSSVTTTATYVSQGLSLGNATLETADGGATNEIRFTNFEPLTINNVYVFDVDGVLNVGANTLTVNASAFTKLGAATNLAGGSIIAPRGITLTAGQIIRASGTISGRIAADVGSTIEATGALTMGDASSPDGFVSRGVLRVFTHTVTLLDSNQAVLGSLTRLGNAGVAGTLNAANGAVLDFGNNIVGFGTLNTPNDVLKPVTNNGAISGNSATEKITLAGYVKGVGSLDFVNITGTNSPGFSPAKVYYGSASYGATGKLISELGGPSAGSAYDQQIYSGTADLAGNLDVELINGYVPTVGDSFTLLSATGGVRGAFSTQTLPSLPEFWSWQLAYGTNDLKMAVATSRLWHNSIHQLDVTNDGHVVAADALEVINYINAFGSGAVPVSATYIAPFIDVDGDNSVAPNDALDVINAINAGLGGEGESNAASLGRGSPDPAPVPSSDLIALLAIDAAQQAPRRRLRY